VNHQLALRDKDALEKELLPEPENLGISADGFARGELFRRRILMEARIQAALRSYR
jgi:hypothetical protein